MFEEKSWRSHRVWNTFADEGLETISSIKVGLTSWMIQGYFERFPSKLEKKSDADNKYKNGIPLDLDGGLREKMI